jgi:hypothetical protein
VPMSAFLGGHLLWQGASEPGGAFQAGAHTADPPLANDARSLGACGFCTRRTWR